MFWRDVFDSDRNRFLFQFQRAHHRFGYRLGEFHFLLVRSAGIELYQNVRHCCLLRFVAVCTEIVLACRASAEQKLKHGEA